MLRHPYLAWIYSPGRTRTYGLGSHSISLRHSHGFPLIGPAVNPHIGEDLGDFDIVSGLLALNRICPSTYTVVSAMQAAHHLTGRRER
jgi:hypothetical protein